MWSHARHITIIGGQHCGKEGFIASVYNLNKPGDQKVFFTDRRSLRHARIETLKIAKRGRAIIEFLPAWALQED